MVEKELILQIHFMNSLENEHAQGHMIDRCKNEVKNTTKSKVLLKVKI